MRRRAFLALAALGLSGRPARAQRAPRAGKSRRVIVVGAGLAGLAAAHELSQAGHDVVVLEARERPGGRVETLRAPFVDGQYADAGGMFVPSHHDLVLRYAERFGLTLQPALPPFHARLSYVRRQRVVANWGGRLDRLFDLAAEDRELGYAGLWDKYVAQGLASRSAEALDRLSVADLLRAQGASAETVALLRVGYLDMMGDGIDSYSALHLQKRLAAAGDSGERLVIAGGAELLPKALAGRLKEKIRYGAAVVRIEPGAARPTMVVVEGGRRERLSADHVICTLPASVLRELEIEPVFSAPKARAIKALDNENPTGAWNTVEVLCLGGKCVHVVNGKVNLVLTNPRQPAADGTMVPLTKGRLQIQSEGAEVFYRGIEIRSIQQIPETYLK